MTIAHLPTSRIEKHKPYLKEMRLTLMACYSAAGFTWGATLGASAPASIVACNTAFGSCQAACAGVLLAPTP